MSDTIQRSQTHATFVLERTPIRVIDTPEVTHLRYRVNGRAALVPDYRLAAAEPASI